MLRQRRIRGIAYERVRLCRGSRPPLAACILRLHPLTVYPPKGCREGRRWGRARQAARRPHGCKAISGTGPGEADSMGPWASPH